MASNTTILGILPSSPVSLTRQKQIRAWYASDSPGSLSDLAREAFEEAKEEFTRDLTSDESKRAWICQRSTMDDVVQTVMQAQSKYEKRTSSKARKWLSRFSARVTYYGAVLDVLVQQQPEYVSLAWGAMKFLFVGIMNHEELLHQLAKALSRIAESLPRKDLTLVLYPTQQMKMAVSHLYAQLIRFMLRATRWFKSGKLMHCFGAIARPFALDFKDDVEKVEEVSRNIDELASAAAKAELRDTHLEMLETRAELREARTEIHRLGELVKAEAYRMLGVASSTLSLTNQLKLDISAQKSMISTVQLNQILSAPFMSELPTSGESFGYCSSLKRRRQQRAHLSPNEANLLQICALDPEISIVIMQTPSQQLAKDFIVDLISLIRASQVPVIWALRFPNFWDRTFDLVDILRLLVLQALDLNPATLASDHPLTLSHLRAAASQTEWLQILDRALYGLKEIYIVVDPDLLNFTASHNAYKATRWIEALPRMISNTSVKVITSAFCIDKGYADRNWNSDTWREICTVDEDVTARPRTRKRQRLAKSRIRRRRS